MASTSGTGRAGHADRAGESGRAGRTGVGAKSRGHAGIIARTLLITVAMFGFGYAMVPMYRVICDITGLNGKTGRISQAEADAEATRGAATPVERAVTVEFIASVPVNGTWKFRPNEATMQVVPGKAYRTTFFAENPRDETLVAQATPSVSPMAAARYFNKTECFCFTRQVFAPHGARDMPVVFVIDPKLPSNVDRVTLSYTFFDSPDQQVNEADVPATAPSAETAS